MKPIFENEQEYIDCITLTMGTGAISDVELHFAVQEAKCYGYIKKTILDKAEDMFIKHVVGGLPVSATLENLDKWLGDVENTVAEYRKAAYELKHELKTGQYVADLLIQKRHQINNPGFLALGDVNFCKLCQNRTSSRVINVCDECYNKFERIFKEKK